MSTPPMLRKARVFARLPLFEQGWLLPVWLLLGLSRAAVLTLPFRMLAARLGDACGVNAWVPLVSGPQLVRARSIGRIVRLASRYTPWDSNCLAQAIVAIVLLRLHGIPCAAFMGVKRSDDASRALLAHAWVHSGAVAVSGGAGCDRFTVVACFTSPRVRASRA